MAIKVAFGTLDDAGPQRTWRRRGRR